MTYYTYCGSEHVARIGKLCWPIAGSASWVWVKFQDGVSLKIRRDDIRRRY